MSGRRHEDYQQSEGEEHAADETVRTRRVVRDAPIGIGDQKRPGERDLDRHMRHRRQDIRPGAEHEQNRPDHRADGGGEREPFPQPQARDAVGRERHESEINDDRPGLRLLRLDQERTAKRGHKPERRQRRAVQSRGDHGQDGDDAEQDERHAGADQAVERISRKGRREGRGCAGGGQDAGDMGR